MKARYFSRADTAVLIFQSLAECFKGVPFSVRIQTQSGGAAFYVSWTDGPNAAQVEAVASRVRQVYFDGSNDDPTARDLRMDAYKASFCVDHILTVRDHSDAAVQSAIDRIYRRYENLFAGNGLIKPTIEKFRSGELSRIHLTELLSDTASTVQAMLHEALAKQSDRLKVTCGKPALRAFVTLSGGYARECCERTSAIPRYDRFGSID
jgi:hypothetical protein